MGFAFDGPPREWVSLACHLADLFSRWTRITRHRLAAGPAMSAWIQSQSVASDSCPTAEQICQMARQGDPLARRAVEREAHYLGLGIANLINLFTPDIIVLAGSLMKSASLFLEEIRGTISRGCRFVPYEKTEIASFPRRRCQSYWGSQSLATSVRSGRAACAESALAESRD